MSVSVLSGSLSANGGDLLMRSSCYQGKMSSLTTRDSEAANIPMLHYIPLECIAKGDPDMIIRKSEIRKTRVWRVSDSWPILYMVTVETQILDVEDVFLKSNAVKLCLM